MSDTDSRLRGHLEDLVPLRSDRGDWQAVERSVRNLRRRIAGVALVAGAALIGAASVTPVGGAISHGFADFSAWLSGDPGNPASSAEQGAFDSANERSWVQFPKEPTLRSLITREIGGHEYELFGFRSGSSLCLRLVVRGLGGGPATGCAPLAELEAAKEPAIVVLADHAFSKPTTPGTSAGPAQQTASALQAQATFGIVADGVSSVEIAADDGRHAATIESNAFLYVAERPRRGFRVRQVFAQAKDVVVEVPFVSAPFDTTVLPAAKPAAPTGPATPDRNVRGGKVAWIDARESRGETPPAELLKRMQGPDGPFEFARLLAPDRATPSRVLIGIGRLRSFGASRGRPSLCVYHVSGNGGGGGCNLLAQPFPQGPFMWTESLEEGGGQFTLFTGLASDEVARMDIYLATGERRPIPLRDNAWLIPVPRGKYPVRLVAYDSDDKVIGIETRRSDITGG
jgi:hypothetical protein